MLGRKLAVAAALVLGATSIASAQAGRPGALSYGPGCYGCTTQSMSGSGAYAARGWSDDQRGPGWRGDQSGLFNDAGAGWSGGEGRGSWQGNWQGNEAGFYDDASSGAAGQPLHTRGNYEYFRSSGPDRGSSIESQR